MDELLLSSMDKYFSLKNQYEKDYTMLKKRIIVDKILSWKEKRIEFQKLKPKCINCKRPVGSIFKNVYDINTLSRKLVAKCGDTINPCPLNIEIEIGETTNTMETINNEKIMMKEYENTIIKYKNDLLFGYSDTKDIVELFQEVKENLDNSNVLLYFFLEKLDKIIDKNDNEIKILTINILDIINGNKILLEKYKKTNDNKIIMNIATNYVNELLPKIKELRDMKYPYSEVNFEDGAYTLFQNKYKISDFEIYSKNIGVIVFNVGVGEETKKTKTKKIEKVKKNEKTKTRRSEKKVSN